jgi:hypothetical protein
MNAAAALRAATWGVGALIVAACGADKEDGGQAVVIGSYPTTPAEGGRPDLGPGGGGGFAGGGSGGASAGGGAVSCAHQGTCAASQSLGIVSGDTGMDQASATDWPSRFVRINVTEDDSGVTGAPMQVYARLISPPGANFDLYAYLDPDSMTLACNAPYAQSVHPAGTDDEISLDWGEGSVPNGGIDGRDVVYEIRHVTGACGPSSEWALSVFGNQL